MVDLSEHFCHGGLASARIPGEDGVEADLLGIVEACPFDAVGLVDRGVLALAGAVSGESGWHGNGIVARPGRGTGTGAGTGLLRLLE